MKEFLTKLRDLQLKHNINLTVCNEAGHTQLVAEPQSLNRRDVELGSYYDLRTIEGRGIILDEKMLNEAINIL